VTSTSLFDAKGSVCDAPCSTGIRMMMPILRRAGQHRFHGFATLPFLQIVLHVGVIAQKKPTREGKNSVIAAVLVHKRIQALLPA